MRHSLVGRDREIEILTHLIDRGRERGGAHLLIGDPGIGKTSLLHVATELAMHRSTTVLSAVGVESEAQMPYAGLHQLLLPVLDQADGLPVRQRNALLSSFGLFNGPRPDHFLVSLAAGGVLMALAAREPVLVVVDDVQWLDPQTHETLAFVVRKVLAAPITLLGSVRTGYAGGLLDEGIPRIAVVGLDRDASDQLLQRRAPDLTQRDRQRLHEEALGNPLALLELPLLERPRNAVDHHHEDLPTRLEGAFAGRLAGLAPSARDAILVAAVDSSDDLVEILASTSVLQGRPCGADLLGPAVAAELVSVSDGRVRFRHPLVRSAVLRSEPVTRVHAANAALAEVISDEPFRRTWHRAESIVGPDDEIADELEASVTTALDRGAVTSAIRAMERSARLTSTPAARGHRLLIAAQHAFAAGRVDLVDGYLREATRFELSDLDLARVQWLRELFSDGVPGDAARVMELCDTARHAAAGDDTDLALDLLLGAALRCWWADAGVEAGREVVRVTTELVDTQADPRHVATLAVAEPVRQATRVQALLDGAFDHGTPDAEALRLLGMAAHAIGNPVLASRLLGAAESELREEGRLALLAQVLGMHVNVQLELGDLAGADAGSAECLQLSVETGQVNWNVGAVAVDARSHALHGDVEQALDLAIAAEMGANRQMLNDYLCCVQAAKGVALLAGDQPGEAYAELRRMFDPNDPSFHPRERFIGIAFLADAAVASGNASDARGVVRGLGLVAQVTPSPLLEVHLLYARAVLEEGPGADALFEEAMSADLEGWPWALARLQLAYGRWILDRDREMFADAVRLLEPAHSYFEEVGASPWAAAAAHLLAVARSSAESMLDRSDAES